MSHKKVIVIASIVGVIIVLIYLMRDKLKKLFVNRQEFIRAFTPVVRNAAKGSGLFPSVFMAQAILESSDNKGIPGNDSLALKHNNYFGIKASKGWTGETVTLPTHEVIDGKTVLVNAAFRKYSTPQQSFNDRVTFLLQNSNYRKAGVFTAKTPEDQANKLLNAHYATDPNYATKLIGIINKYNLKSIDA